MRRSLRGLEREGFRHVFRLSSPEKSMPLPSSASHCGTTAGDEHGPFDIIGDVHGCLDELLELMAQLGYPVERSDEGYYGDSARGPQGRLRRRFGGSWTRDT